MRKLGLALVALLVGGTAVAEQNDFRIQQLGNPTDPDITNALTANVNFAGFAREFAAALTSSNLVPPATLGHAGFNVAVELSTVNINGSLTPSSEQFLFPTLDNFDKRDHTLLLPSIHIRKGLPFSFEIGMKATLIDKSTMGSALGELRFGINEGFAYLPDVCGRVYTMRLFNTKDFNLGATGLDLGVGKRFAIGGMVTLHPYVGWNPVWVRASSAQIVDFRQERTYAESVQDPYTQLTDNAGQYYPVRPLDNGQSRFYAGARFIGGILQLGAEVSYTGIGKVRVMNPNGISKEQDFPAVTAFNTTIGLDF
jgi:hypothetical protein